MKILREYSDRIEQYSIDESFIDMTGSMCHFSDPIQAAMEIKDRIRDTLGFTVNVGISSNKLLAKMASDFQKPDRVHTLYPEEIPYKMWNLPVGDLFYVGRASQKRLNLLGIQTIGQLAHASPDMLFSHLKSHGLLIWSYANGIDDSEVIADIPDNKGYGNSTTTAFDVCDEETARMVILSLCENLGARIRKDNAQIQTVSVSIRYQEDLSHASRQMTLDEPTDITNELYSASCTLFHDLWNGKPARHIGVHTSKVTNQNGFRQISLFDRQDFSKLRTLDRTIDEIRSRYGRKAVFRSCFLSNPELSPVSGGISEEKRGLHKND